MRLFLFATFALALMPAAGRAGTHTVLNTADSGAGSLRQAIADATASAGDDTIVFDGGLDGMTIGLSSGQIIINDVGGKTTIDASALTNGVTISPAQTSRIFQVNADSVVELKNLTLRDGKTGDGTLDIGTNGGAILNLADLTLVDCLVTENQTGRLAAGTNRSGHGGAVINMPDTTFTAIDCVFTNNRTGDSDSDAGSSPKTGRGGAIFASAGITLTRCDFTGNRTGEIVGMGFGATGEGGAIYCNRGAVLVEDCSFQTNETGTGGPSGRGGAIYTAGTDVVSLTIRDSQFTSNATGSEGSIGDGGAIFFGSGALEIERCSFSMNHTGQWTIPFGVVASGDGGALFVNNLSGPATIDDTTFDGNYTGDATVGGNGGAVYLTRAEVTFSRCQFDGNHTGDGGVGFDPEPGNGGSGGAIFQVGSDPVTLVDCEFEGNYTGDAGQTMSYTTPAYGGGGGAIYNTDELFVDRCTFKDNRTGIGCEPNVPGGPGGAIMNHDIASCTIKNSTFVGNETGKDAVGGAIVWFDRATGILLNCTVTGNTSTGPNGKGGGLWSDSYPWTQYGVKQVKVDNCVIAGNTAVTAPDVYEDRANTYLFQSATPKNLIGINDGAAASFPAGGLIGTSGTPVVPQLEVLADNGGHTLTRAPTPGGNVIDAGDSLVAPAGNDQRHSVRIFGSAVDLGSVEHAVPPDVPAGLTVTGAETGVSLSWTGGANTDSYRVWRHTADEFASAVEIGNPVAATFEDESTAPGAVHYYWVTAVNVAFESLPGASASGNRLPVTVPDGLTATNTTAGIPLAWNATTHGESYRLYRSASDASGTSALVMSTAGTAYTDMSTTAGDIFYYWVKAVVDGFESDFSAGATGTHLHPPVGNVAATDRYFDDRVRLTWDGAPGVAEYVIYRNTAADMSGAEEVGRVAAGIARWDDRTAAKGAAYFYAIRPDRVNGEEVAVSSWAEGERSAVITFRPDVLVGKKAAAKIGNGTYNASGAGQTVKIRSKRRKALKIYLRMEADGSQADVLKILGTRGNRTFKAKYLGPGNVTAAVIQGTHSASLASGAGVELKLITKRKGRKTGRLARKSFVVTGRSSIIPARKDTALGKVWSG